MNLEISGLSTPDGIYADVRGLDRPFRFRIGNGRVGKLKRELPPVWHVDSAVGMYALQFIPRPIEPPDSVDDLDCLLEYFVVEMAFLRDKIGIEADRTSIRTMDHPGQFPVVTWMTSNPQVPDQRPGVAPATPFAAHAVLLHGRTHVLHLSITGFGDDWSEHDLRVQVTRAAFSYAVLDT